MTERVVIVTGSLDWTDRDAIYDMLDELQPTLVVEGGARGADAMARAWARDRAVENRTFAADWKVFGKGAGPKRNVEMLATYPNATVVGAPVATSRGTVHCLRVARHNGHEIKLVRGAVWV